MTERSQQGEAGEGGDGGSQEGSGGSGGGGEPPSQDLSKNWFSAENTLRVYGEVRVEQVWICPGEVDCSFFASCRVLLSRLATDSVSV